jgi:hypothetical protein
MSVSASAVTVIVVIGVNGMNYIFLVSLAPHAGRHPHDPLATFEAFRDGLVGTCNFAAVTLAIASPCTRTGFSR